MKDLVLKRLHRLRMTLLSLFFGATALWASEFVRPVSTPETSFSFYGIAELDDDVYSADLVAVAEFAVQDWLSLYADGSFRMLSYSYEYSMEGYVHNYANLHVNGFNETYVGAKAMIYDGLGLNVGWRFPPGEGSRRNRFHRLKVEPFAVYNVSKNLVLGSAMLYNTFLEEDDYQPGDEVGVKLSLVWKPFWKEGERKGWEIVETFLFQSRFEHSENLHLKKPYRQMDDQYSGMKLTMDLSRYFELYTFGAGVGLRYELQRGTLFGFETGHRLGVFATIR